MWNRGGTWRPKVLEQTLKVLPLDLPGIRKGFSSVGAQPKEEPDGTGPISAENAGRQAPSSQQTLRMIRPVLLSGAATALLYGAVDRSQPWSLISAGMGILMFGAVLAHQLGQIIRLERQVLRSADQLSVVSEVISALNHSSNLGSSLTAALDRLVEVLQAEAAAIWLPSPQDPSRLVLVEQRGLSEPEQLLLRVRERLATSGQRTLGHMEELASEGHKVNIHCLTVLMGHGMEEFGYLFLARRSGAFTTVESAIVSAVGSDVGNALRNLRAVSEARRLADRDGVTGLHNHRSVYQRLHAEVEKHQKAGRSLAVIMMDLDNFKLFNDTYGHPAGDEVLKRVSGVLRRTCGEQDTVARYGGDEFMVVLPETNLKAAMRCAEKIQATLSKERFRCENSASLPIGFSYGISVFPDDATDVLELVSNADANLYESKAAGGNQITARGASPTDNTLVHVKGFDLFRAMVQAIDNKDGYTRKHSEEVTEYSLEIARAMRLDDEMLQTIRLSGILHDVGKIGVPDSVLRKPGRLTDEEFHIMKQHPVFGALIVGAMPGMEEVVLGVRHHHERWDGFGYPDKLVATDIPLIGRIMAVADAYSAMTTSRPYRKGLTERQALKEINANLGTQFDPDLGALFVRIREEKLAAKAETRKARAGKKAEKEEPALVEAGAG